MYTGEDAYGEQTGGRTTVADGVGMLDLALEAHGDGFEATVRMFSDTAPCARRSKVLWRRIIEHEPGLAGDMHNAWLDCMPERVVRLHAGTRG